VNSSISRQLILWLAVPLMLLALCGALVHYFNRVAPDVISSDRRLKAASNALMAHVVIKDGRVALAANVDAKPYLPDAETIMYALRDPEGRLLVGDAGGSRERLERADRRDGAGGRTQRTRAIHAIRYPCRGSYDHRGRYPASE
jgi:Two-component sensor kinase N-terminal